MKRITNLPGPRAAFAKLAHSGQKGVKSAISGTRSIGRRISDAVRGTNTQNEYLRRRERAKAPHAKIRTPERRTPSAAEQARSEKRQGIRAALSDLGHRLAEKYGKNLTYDEQRELSRTIDKSIDELRLLDEVKPRATSKALQLLKGLEKDDLPPLEEVLEEIEAIFTPGVDQGKQANVKAQAEATSSLEEQWAVQDLIEPRYQLKSKIRALDIVSRLTFEPERTANQKIEDATGRLTNIGVINQATAKVAAAIDRDPDISLDDLLKIITDLAPSEPDPRAGMN